jgi:hypothetical protein
MPSVGELFAAYILLVSIIAGSTALHAAMEDMCYESVLDRKKQFPWKQHHEDLLVTNVVYHKAHMCKHGEGAKTWEMITNILITMS